MENKKELDAKARAELLVEKVEEETKEKYDIE
jgi:hypothetical protein